MVVSVVGGEQQVLEAGAGLGRDPAQGGERPGEVLGQVAEFGVGLLGAPLQDRERLVGGEAVNQQQRALDLFDRFSRGEDFGQFDVEDVARSAATMSVMSR